MKVHLVSKKTLLEFKEKHPSAAAGLLSWLDKLKAKSINEPGDFRKVFSSSDLLGRGSSRVIFNIAGNHFRMICRYYFGAHELHLLICWMGTHAEYSKICSSGEQYNIQMF